MLKIDNEDVLVGVGESIAGKCIADGQFRMFTNGWRCSSKFLNVVHYKDWIEETLSTGS